MKNELIAKLGTKLMDALKRTKYRRGLKVALVIVPVIVWDAFYFIVKKIYALCSWLDKRGGEYIQNFVEN